MWSFLSEFTRDLKRTCTVIVLDEEEMHPPRQYTVHSQSLLLFWSGTLAAAALCTVLLLVFTPLRELIPGYGTEELKQQARMNALRVEAMQDSLDEHRQYQAQLQQLITGQVDSSFLAATNSDAPTPAVDGGLEEETEEPSSENWADHEQPALSVDRLPVRAAGSAQVPISGERYLSSMQFPVMPPVDGFITREFDARTGHYAIDLAVQEGTAVRSIGDGYVILADWTQEGGYAIGVQHADGYVSLYKHNERLLKRVGDRVREREAIALSGNSGEITTGPHLHVELWRNGLAQDPSQHFILP